MTVLRRWVLVCGLFCLAGNALWAASPAEQNAFDVAKRDRFLRIWDRAESEFASFTHTFTNSALLPEAYLYQAHARFMQSNYAGAIELISAHQPQAGPIADQYLLLLGEAYFHHGELQPAGDTFAKLVRDFPASTNRLKAAVAEAAVLSRLNQWPKVIDWLAQTNGPFQAALRANAAADWTNLVAGSLLLSKSQLALNNCPQARLALEPLAKQPLAPAEDWQRTFLFCQIDLAENKLPDALENTTNLLVLAASTGQRRLRADSVAVQADILERLGRLEEALAAYTNNLAEAVPAERQRQALLKLAELSLSLKRLPQAAQLLDKFLGQYPKSEAADLALLALGEVRLRQYQTGECTNLVSAPSTNAPTDTNCLGLALQALQSFVQQFPQSSFFGKAQLDLGWCFWLTNRFAESQAAFQTATERLPFSADQATAYLKLADAQFRQTNLTAAIANYRIVGEKFASLPEVQTNLWEPALYQIVRAGLICDLPAASNAVATLVTRYPEGFYTDRAVLLAGQELSVQNPGRARELLQEFARAVPNASLLPEVELAVARTYEMEQRWEDAIRQYDTWLASFTNHIEGARAEYSRALANLSAGHYTNALAQFSRFVSLFPADPLAPVAQWSVADFYYRAGHFEAAETNYAWCYQNTNWPADSDLAYQARMMAGRCAFARQGWKEAKDYFGKLAPDTNCPPDLQAQAWFALGDTWVMSLDPTNKLADYGQAINAYDKICLFFPSNRLAALAWGAKGNCYLQCQDFPAATNAFQRVIDSPAPDIVAARSSAKVGLGLAFEQLRLFTAARDEYLDVFEKKSFLRPGEDPDPFWTAKAGQEAVRVLAEVLHQPEQARRLCELLQQQFPNLHLQNRIASLQAQEEAARQKD